MYEEFTLILFKIIFNLIMTRSIVGFLFFIEQCNNFITLERKILQASLQGWMLVLIMVTNSCDSGNDNGNIDVNNNNKW